MRIRIALAVSTADRYASMVVNFAVLAVIARLMTPSEFGAVVIGTAVTSIAVAAREFASQTYLINRIELGTPAVRACFTLMMLTTLPMCGIIIASAPWLEATFGEPGLAFYLHLIALALLFEPFGQLQIGLLRRDFAFGRVAAVNLTSVLVQAATVIALAADGHGFVSFGWSWVIASVASAGIAIALRPDLSVFVPSLAGTRDAVRFGLLNGSAALLHRLYEAVPMLVLGHLLALRDLGLLQRALSLSLLPDKVLLAGVGAVVLPAFTRAVREGRNLAAPYLHAVSLVTALQWPALATVAILAEPIVRIVLGEQWPDVAPFLRILAVATMFSFSNELNYPVLVATGAMRQNLVRALIMWPLSSVILIASGTFGLHAAVLSYLVIMPLQAFVSIHAMRHCLDLPLRRIVRATGRSAIVTLATIIGPLAIVATRPSGQSLPLSWFAIAMAFAALGWIAAIAATRHPAWQEVVRLLPHRVPGKAAAALAATPGSRPG